VGRVPLGRPFRSGCWLGVSGFCRFLVVSRWVSVREMYVFYGCCRVGEKRRDEKGVVVGVRNRMMLSPSVRVVRDVVDIARWTFPADDAPLMRRP
jgi:hypothetical protein